MPDHFHLAVLTKRLEDIPPDLTRNPRTLGNTFGHLQNAYAKYFNHICEIKFPICRYRIRVSGGNAQGAKAY